MGYSNDGTNDFEKLRLAFVEITRKFGSVDDLLASVGLANMPVAQRYGILFGILVFALTITAVMALLIFGGTFKRISEQTQTGEISLLSSHDLRTHRALLMEQLLEGRERMKQNYPEEKRTEGLTNLAKMLLNEAPGFKLGELVNEGSDSKKADTNERYVPPFYQINYEKAYRKCQDRPGGSILSGRPEARFEAYARGFAGCGPYTSAPYRRSYGRLYEAICCSSHANDDKYATLFTTRPYDIVGHFVRLEALDVERHLKEVYRITSGEPALDYHSFDPQEVWSFLEAGPFESEKEMRQSFVFQRRVNEAGFAIVHSVTDRVLGVVLLAKDDPMNLSIQLEPPIMPPTMDATQQQLESCFLLMDRVFGFGYRRIQLSVDSQDAVMRKLATRLGFTLEGILYKQLIVKSASRDSNVYSMLNSDWKAGARAALFKKLYGAAAFRFDSANEKREEEYDEQQRVLAEKRQSETKDKKV